MTNPMFNPQPNYSGVTIQIANPSVNVSPNQTTTCPGYAGIIPQGNLNQTQYSIPNRIPYKNAYGELSKASVNPYDIQNGSVDKYGTNYAENVQNPYYANTDSVINEQNGVTNPIKQGYPNAYPAQYYLNNYNYGVNGNGNGGFNDAPNGTNGTNAYENINGQNRNFTDNSNINKHGYPQQQANQNIPNQNIQDFANDNENGFQNEQFDVNSYKMYADKNEPKETDMTRSTNIIDGIDERVAEEAKEKKNTKEKKIVALTDEYIKSLENYLNNPNDEIRLMASKEVLKRLDEDKDRYNDAALNALLNKMMQDPAKLVRIAALSAFASRLASGNDYTVQLLHNIQSNPNADKEDVLQAADILLKMSAGVEVKNIPIPESKQKK